MYPTLRLLACLLLIVSRVAAAEPPPALITGDALITRQAAGDRSLVVLAVRTPEEFAAGHVPGAINVPHDALESRLDAPPQLRDHDAVVYCKTGRRAGIALAMLARHGYTRLQHLDGDMEGWRTAARPVEQSPAPPR